MKTEIRSCDNNTLIFECEECEGKYLDTKCTLNNNLLCWVTFSEIDEFANKLFDVISHYRI